MSGTAMGTKMAPSYANLFMGVLENQMLCTYHHKPLVYFRYIDDIFMIWTEGEESLHDFLKHCNNQNKNILFKQTVSNTSIPFLDVNVTLNNGKLHTDLYSKPTDKHQYLYYTSCHPKHTKTSLPYCLALRLRRICSTEKDFEIRIKEMTQHLLNRGYKKGCIKDAINKAASLSREDALTKRNKPKSIQKVPLVITYNPMLPNIPKILNESQTILHASERCTEVFPNVPLVSYRRARNLSDMLCSRRIAQPVNSTTLQHYIKPHISNNNQCPQCGIILKNDKGLKIHVSSKHNRRQNKPVSPGFWPCQSDNRCNICKQGLFCSEITSTKNDYTHQIKQSNTCKTKNVCYLINCKKCKQQYTGETKLEFHHRMNNHKSDIRTKNKSTGMVRHFSECGIENIQPVILERVRSSDPFIRKAREQLYIERLGTEINAQ